MRKRVCLFAGTTEGRVLAQLLHKAADLTVCVATEYGEELLGQVPGIAVRVGRLDAEGMASFFGEGHFSVILDATHPYAEEVTANIAQAASKTGIPVLRILRGDGSGQMPAGGSGSALCTMRGDGSGQMSAGGSGSALCTMRGDGSGQMSAGGSDSARCILLGDDRVSLERVPGVVYVASATEACAYLAEREGNIFLTTGAKELAAFAGIDKARLFARVLPLASSLEACARAGIPSSHIVAAQGPFSHGLNLEQLRMFGARYLVTKESGQAGGFAEKISAAREAGVQAVIIGKPKETDGLALGAALLRLIQEFGIPVPVRLAETGFLGQESTAYGANLGGCFSKTADGQGSTAYGANAQERTDSDPLAHVCTESAPHGTMGIGLWKSCLREARSAPHGTMGMPERPEPSLSGTGKMLVCSEKKLPAMRTVCLVGIGPGNQELLTPAARNALLSCDAALGARSVLLAVESLVAGKPVFYEYKPERILDILSREESICHAAVVLRGDTGFFSGAKHLLESLKGFSVQVIPGISSVSCFAARLGVGYDEAAVISMHGRDGNLVRRVDSWEKTFVLAGGEYTPEAICKRLCAYGLGNLRVVVGEHLSCPEERVTEGTALECSQRSFDNLAIVYIENPGLRKRLPIGIPDDFFVRGEVPMTKAEVRAVSLSKLALLPDSVVYDIGAGTGSVSVECALTAYEGRVYAIEKEAAAARLIRKNKEAFRADNITLVEGEAPAILKELPRPTHAFIGGSGGKLREIVALLLAKNPAIRIVVNTLTLESLAEVLLVAREFAFETFETVTLNVSRSQKAGRLHLMRSQNPVSVSLLQSQMQPCRGRNC